MQKNLKEVGRYVYGGKIVIGHCPKCGAEELIDCESLESLMKTSYVRLKKGIMSKVIGIFL